MTGPAESPRTLALPSLIRVTPQGRGAVLTTQGGRVSHVFPSDRVIFAPDVGALICGGRAYHVPAYLFDELRRALSLSPLSSPEGAAPQDVTP